MSFPRDQDEKFYYETKIAPLLNKAFVERRAQIVTRVKQQWMGEFDGEVEKCFRQHFSLLTSSYAFAVDSKQPTPKGKLVLALMKRLVDDSESITDHTGLFCEFVSSFACKIYSKSYLQKQLKKKKGSRLLDVVTPSDMAMVTAVMENSHEVWKDEERISEMTRDEQEKFKKKNQGGMSEEEREHYQK